MSPGIQIITDANLPLTVLDPDIKCPACGRWMVITVIDAGSVGEDGRVMARGLRTTCSTEPPTGSARWNGWRERHMGPSLEQWNAVNRQIFQWFDAWFRYRHVEPEVLARKRRTKWRRMA